MAKRVALLGLGNMGSALGRALVAHCSLTVYNRTASKAEAVAASGASVARSVAEAVHGSDVIVLNVLNHQAVLALLQQDGVFRALKGKSVIQLTNVTTQDAKDMAAMAEQHGFKLLLGAILGYPKDVGLASMAIACAGDANLFEAHKDVLTVLGPASFFVSPNPAAAAALNVALIGIVVAGMLGFLQGGALCAKEGLDMATFSGVAQGLLPLLGSMFADAAGAVQQGQYDPTILHTAPNATWMHELENLHSCQAGGQLPTSFTEAMQAHLRRLPAGEDMAAAFKFFGSTS